MQLDPITRAVLDAMQEGVLIIDAQERIVYGNRAYVAFLEKEAGGPIGPIEGYPLRLLRPGARLPEVLAQKRPILHTPRQASEDISFVNMYPIFDGAEVVGGLSVVTFWKDAFDFRAELERYEKRSRQVLRRVNKANAAHYTFDSIVAVSPRSAACRELASRLAQTDVTVLLQSESGTGKELYAQAIHNASPRSAGVFVAINCANFNANMLESELFGYTEGAFTGAKRGGKIGLFEAAAGGTLFLDEISEMDVGLQSKLLRALQERRIRPVGGVEEVETDVRIIAATNQNLVEAIEKGKFRRDLYYRLNVYPIIMPSLRERKEDIPLLAEHFALRAAGEMGKVPVTFTEAALEILKNHTWPGNIRELENCIERLTIIASGTAITPERLASCAVPGGGDASRPSAPGSAFPLDLDRQLAETERDLILRALEETGGVQVKAAELLNISERSMWHRIKKLGINIINKKEMI